MKVIGTLLGLLLTAAIGAVIAAAVLVLMVMPRLQWNATARPSAAEVWASRYVLRGWLRVNAPDQRNPLTANAKNLQEGEQEYNEHCAVCHALDGSGENRVGAEFYPPVVRLRKGARFLSDGAFYFIVSNGIRMTGMPGFGTRTSSDELWKIILWVRHFPDLTPQERGRIQAHEK
jgi:mono/diheme cytochrome c family protein